MMETTTNWVPGLVVLAVGVLGALVYLVMTKLRAQGTSPKELKAAQSDARAKELEAHARMLIDELRELQANRHQFSDEQFNAEKSRLELAAAKALRERDEHLAGRKLPAATGAATPAASTAAAASAPPAKTGLFARHPELKGAVWGGAIVLFFGALGLTLFRDEKARDEGGSMTGGSSAQMGAPQDPEAEFEQALSRAMANPQDAEFVALVSHELIRRQRYDEASSLTERALGSDPFHVENRIHRAFLKAPRGDGKGAFTELMHLANTYRGAQEALLLAGSIGMQTGDKAGALEAFERYQAEAPANEQPPQLAEAIRMLKASP